MVAKKGDVSLPACREMSGKERRQLTKKGDEWQWQRKETLAKKGDEWQRKETVAKKGHEC